MFACDGRELTFVVVWLRSQKSAPALNLSIEKRHKRERRRSLSLSLDEALEDDPDYLFSRDGSCIGAECFSGRKRSVHGNGHVSDTEVSKKENGSGVTSTVTPTTSQELDPNIIRKLENDLAMHDKETEGSSHGSAARLGGGSSHGNKEVKFGAGMNKALAKEVCLGGNVSAVQEFGKSELPQGPLHAAWNNMQDTYTEVSGRFTPSPNCTSYGFDKKLYIS